MCQAKKLIFQVKCKTSGLNKDREFETSQIKISFFLKQQLYHKNFDELSS